MARPSLIADPITAFGKRKPNEIGGGARREVSIVQRLKAEIRPKAESQLRPLQPYKSPRDETRDRVANEILYQQRVRDSGGITSYQTDKQSLDVVLPRLHGATAKRRPYDFGGKIY